MLRTRFGLVPIALCAVSITATAQTPYGHGTPNASGVVPRLRATPHYLGNSSVAYTVDRGAPFSAAALFASAAPATANIGGSNIFISLLPGAYQASLVTLLDASGVGEFASSIPASATSLLGVELFLQAAVLDAPAPGTFLPTSNGVRVEVTEEPLLFLATIASPATDTFTLMEPSTLTVVQEASMPQGDRVTGAVFVDGGRDLYAASANGMSIERLDLRVAPPTWSVFATVGESLWGLEYDPRAKRLYTFAGAQAEAKDLIVFDADPASAGYGTELTRVVDFSTLQTGRQWDLATAAQRIAMYSGNAVRELQFVDVDPASATYLQVVGNDVVPGLQPPFNSIARVRSSADASMVFVVMNVGYFTVPSGLHRYDAIAQQWIDHSPTFPGVQAIGQLTSPAGPQITSSDFALSRDESFGVLMGYSTLVRLDFDRDDPTAWGLTNVSGVWPPSTSFGHAITADDKVLLLGPLTLNGTENYLIDPFTGAVLAQQSAATAAWYSSVAER